MNRNSREVQDLAETIYQIAGKEPQPTASHSGFSGNRFFSDSRSGGAKWSGGLSGDGVPQHLDHRRLRLNARRAVHDNLNARSIVERYSEDRPYPSCLLLGWMASGDPLHIVCSRGDAEPALRIVTFYEPVDTLWENDYKTRKARR